MKLNLISSCVISALVCISATCRNENNETNPVSNANQDTASVDIDPNSFNSSNAALPDANKKKESSEVVYAKKIIWLDFESGYMKAKKENKKILVDCYTDWCGWCKVMDRNTFTDSQVIQFINKNFIAVKLNPEVERNYKFDTMSKGAYDLMLWLSDGNNYGYPTFFYVNNPNINFKKFLSSGYEAPVQYLKTLEIINSKF